jgi:hypothetical protein
MLPLFLYDYLTGSVTGFALRYSAPSSLGWTLMLAFLCAVLSSQEGAFKWAGRAVAVAVLSLGASYSYAVHNERVNFARNYYDHGELVDFLKSSHDYALSSDAFVGDVLILADELPPETRISWNARCFSCPRQLTPVVDIPGFPVPPAKLYYFRSWVNMFSNEHLAALTDDTLNDGRYHTRPLDLGGPSRHLFELIPREQPAR